MELSDEDFIEHFAALSSESLELVDIPQQVTNQRVWELCTIATVITENQVNLYQFSPNMMRIWGVHPHTEISVLDKNLFLVQFVTEEELRRIFNKGVWTYRGDAVAMKRIQQQTDLAQP